MPKYYSYSCLSRTITYASSMDESNEICTFSLLHRMGMYRLVELPDLVRLSPLDHFIEVPTRVHGIHSRECLILRVVPFPDN